MTIYFYAVQDEFGWLSNFSPHAVRVGKQKYATVEHLFQSSKFLSAEDRAAVRQAKTPMLAARMGRDRRRKLRRDWESAKRDVMLRGLRAKVEQHPELADALLATGEERLVEHTANDTYWGDGGDGTGQNWLGRLWMQVRQELRDGGSRRHK